MADMLVKLYKIPHSHDIEENLLKSGIKIKKALAPDRSRIIVFVRTCAKDDYSDEIRAAFSNNPVTCYIATREKELVGFACYEAAARNFFGPMAVLESERKKGVGKALLLNAMESMRELGYAYAIIGWPTNSAISFYKKCVGAIMIDEKSSGVSKEYLRLFESGCLTAEELDSIRQTTSRKTQDHWNYAQSIAPDIFIFIGKTLGLIEIALSAVMFLFHASIHTVLSVGGIVGLGFLFLGFYKTDSEIEKKFM